MSATSKPAAPHPPTRTARALAVGGVVALLSAGAVVGSAQAAGTSATTTGGLAFSHEVIVDHQRSGFEPDILVDSKDHLYTSVPNGSSEATSFIWSSRDHGNSFQFVPSAVAHGKPLGTCPQGGGDTELQLDKKDNLFFSDLENLTNLANAVSTDGGATFTGQCVSVPNTPVDRMWYAVQGSMGDPDFAIYEEYDAVESGADPNNAGGNQLVETVSSDGINFVPVLNNNPTSGDCFGAAVYNCITNDEGISGNQLLAPDGTVYIAHSTADGNGVAVSWAKPTLTRVAGKIVSASATWTTQIVNKSLCPDVSGQAPGICGSTQFATIARDSGGTLYVSFSSRKTDANGNQTGPYNVYVVHSTGSGSSLKWSAPTQVSKTGTNSFSWVTAGSAGRAAMAWYHSDEASEGGKYTFDDLTHTEFSVEVGMSTNATSANPTYSVATVSEHPIKYGPICTGGLGCTISGGDRSLGDFLEVSHDNRGALILSYVDDTSNTYTTGATGFAENGPPVVSRQIAGPSLVKGTANPTGVITGPAGGPGQAMNTVTDPATDANYSANGMRTPTGSNLDILGTGIGQDANGLIVQLRVGSLSTLQVSPTLGGTTGEWLVRFTTYNPHTLGNGHIYYAGMESTLGQAPTFYDGDTSAPQQSVQLSQNFSSAHTTAGSYDAKTGIVTIHVPFADVPGVKKGALLYSATALTASTLGPLSLPNPTGLTGELNILDASTPYDYRVATHAVPVSTTGTLPSAAKPAAASTNRSSSSTSVADTGLSPAVPLAALGLVLLGLAAVRRRRAS